MNVEIQIKEILLNASEVYKIDSYNDDCIHIVTDESGNKAYMIPIKANGAVYHIGSYSAINHIFKPIKDNIPSELMDISEGKVSESFALKAIAVAIRGDMVNFKDIE